MRALRGILLCFLCMLSLAGCDGSIHLEAAPEEGPVLAEAAAAVLSDGTTVDRWRREVGVEDDWRLSDGTPLLCVNDMIGPENVYVGGVENLDDLSEPARSAIIAYYEQQGLRYDLQAELEKAYTEYQSCQSSGETYYERWVHQETCPCAFNDRIACFMTATMLPLGGQEAWEERLGTVFDRETGEPIDKWELFTLPPEEAFERILDAAGIQDTQLRAEMQAALRPEYIILFPQYISVEFPHGFLPSQSTDYHLAADYPDIKGVLQAWAVPDEGV